MPFNNKRNSRDDSPRRGRKSNDNFKSNSRPGNKRSSDSSDRKPFREDPLKSKESSRPFSGSKSFKSSSDGRKSSPFAKNERSSDRKFSNDKRDSDRDGRRPFKRDSDFSDKKFSNDRRESGGNRDKTFRNRDEQNDQGKTYFQKRKFSPAKNPASRQVKDDGLIRLNRYISNSGICSRRKADELITAGVITVNGEVVTELGTKVDPAKDEIRYNNERLKREKMVYVLLNKPKDYITTTDDPQERKTVMHLVSKATRERIYPVGRLDRNTTGLLLLTNDGGLAEKLSHPRNNISKVYHIELSKNLTQGDLNKIQFGLELEDGFIKPDDVSYVAGGSKNEIGIQIHSGKNRIVRRIFEHLGYEVIKLDRVVYANLTKKDLPRGRWRYLEERELIQLKHFIK